MAFSVAQGFNGQGKVGIGLPLVLHQPQQVICGGVFGA
ncbi:MAG: hypothetical protein KPEEDBHJ_02709 [Anaerolineales bacterium]|nr:hypothetical protein [Anaerolineales bacterium]